MAMERDLSDGRADALCFVLRGWRRELFGVVPGVRGEPEDRLQVAGAVSGLRVRWGWWTGRGRRMRIRTGRPNLFASG